MPESLKKKTFIGIFWSSAERFSVQGIQFVIQIIMARLLLPSDYGLIGMLTIFMAISQSFIDSGFSNALIRKTDRTEIDFSTVFYFNIVVGAAFYLILFASSPLIAQFYNMPILDILMKVLGINLIINSLTVIQRAKLTINLDFKTQAKASIASVIVSGGVGIGMAYSGYGVWALVAQSILQATIDMALLWICSKWFPKRTFSWNSFKEMFSFGSKLLLSGLMDTTYNNIYPLIIGKFFTAQKLGFFTRADQFAQFPSSNITNIIGRVFFPVVSNIQDDDERLKDVYRRYIKMSAFIVFPLMMGLAALAHPLIHTLLKDKWDGVVLLLQIICFAYMWYPIHAINLNLLQVKGRSDLFLQLEIIKKIMGIAILCFTVPRGILAMCLGIVFEWTIGLVINTYYTGKLIQVGFIKQMKDLLPILFYALSMGALVWFSTQWIKSPILQLIAGIVIGVLYYFLATYLTRSNELKEILSLVKKKN